MSRTLVAGQDASAEEPGSFCPSSRLGKTNSCVWAAGIAGTVVASGVVPAGKIVFKNLSKLVDQAVRFG